MIHELNKLLGNHFNLIILLKVNVKSSGNTTMQFDFVYLLNDGHFHQSPSGVVAV